MIERGHHKRTDLALRHRGEIARRERISPEAVKVYRFNADGRRSKRGHNYSFKWEEKPKETTYIFRGKYQAAEGGEINEYDFSFIGPQDLSKDDAYKLAADWLKTGLPPHGTRNFKIIKWADVSTPGSHKHGGRGKYRASKAKLKSDEEDFRLALDNFASREMFKVSTRTVRGRRSTR